MLALLGFATLGVFFFLVATTRTPVIAALVLTPLAAALAGGFGAEIGVFAVDGLKTVAPVASLMLFAVLYFGLMLDVGLFNPLIERLLRLVGGDPIKLCLATAALAMLVALDGDGATTFLISVTALLPVHRRLGLNPLVLPGIVALVGGRDEPAAVGRSDRESDDCPSCWCRPSVRAGAARDGRGNPLGVLRCVVARTRRAAAPGGSAEAGTRAEVGGAPSTSSLRHP